MIEINNVFNCVRYIRPRRIDKSFHGFPMHEASGVRRRQKKKQESEFNSAAG